MNALYVMHELCLPFLNLNDPKEMWKKIDPTYLTSGYRIDLSNETPINSDPNAKKDNPIKFAKEYGTISEFYFMELEIIHFGLMHTINNYTDLKKIIDKYKQDRENIRDESMIKKIDKELSKLKSYKVGYEMFLADNNLAK